jgi:hypothetical protein
MERQHFIWRVKRNLDILELLTVAEADKMIRDNKGLTPLQLAEALGDNEAIDP